MQGTVNSWNEARGFGFIKSDEVGPDTFVHVSELHRAGVRDVHPGQRVEFDVTTGHDGRKIAGNVRALVTKPQTQPSERDGRALMHSVFGTRSTEKVKSCR